MRLQQGLSGKIPGGILCQKRKLFIAGGHTLYAVLHTMPFCSQIQEEGHQSRDHGFFKVHAKYLIEERFRGNLIEFNGEADHVHILFELPPSAHKLTARMVLN